MQELEKILEEIELEKKRLVFYPDCSSAFSAVQIRTIEKIEQIICKYMSNCKHMNDGWIPVEKRLPEDDMPMPKLVTALVPDRKAGWDTSETFSVVVDTDVYDPGYTGKWECYKKNVIAWRPLPDPYQAERSDNNDGE